MRYLTLPGTGLRVAEIALGAMRFGAAPGNDGDAARAARDVFDCYVEAGGNFIDTANVYNAGASEDTLRDLIAADRDHLVIASKYGMAGAGGDITTSGGSRKAMAASVDASLRRLGTDRLDILYLHLWDPRTPVDEVARGMEDLVRQGKLLYAGLSNVPAWVAARFATVAELRGSVRPAAIQISYQLLDRSAERELLPMAEAMAIAVTAWSPLAQGLLAGRHLCPDGSVEPAAAIDERTRSILAALGSVARALGASPAQVALAWLRLHPSRPVIPVVGVDTVAQMHDTLASTALAFTPDQLAALAAASAIEPGYPSGHLAQPVFRNLLTAFQPERLIPATPERSA